MPYKNVFVPCEKMLEYKDVTVYHVYREDEWEQGIYTFWYGLQPDASTYADITDGDKDGSFDIRELPEYKVASNPESHTAILRAAIDNGTLTQTAINLPTTGA